VDNLLFASIFLNRQTTWSACPDFSHHFGARKIKAIGFLPKKPGFQPKNTLKTSRNQLINIINSKKSPNHKTKPNKISHPLPRFVF
jgi:hypothetical protein